MLCNENVMMCGSDDIFFNQEKKCKSFRVMTTGCTDMSMYLRKVIINILSQAYTAAAAPLLMSA